MPTIKVIAGRTRVLGAPPNWTPENHGHCSALPVRDEVIDGLPWMVSAHEFSPTEIKALTEGAVLELWIQGTTHPVIGMRVRQEEVSHD